MPYYIRFRKFNSEIKRIKRKEQREIGDIMFINFGFEDNLEIYILEIKMGNNIQRQQLQGTSDMVQLQFMQLMQEVGNTNQPIRLRIIKQEEIWNQYSQSRKILENYIQFANKSYMNSFASEFKGA